jgi:hypothetical protein
MYVNKKITYFQILPKINPLLKSEGGQVLLGD